MSRYSMPQGEDVAKFMEPFKWGLRDPEGIGRYNESTGQFEIHPAMQIVWTQMHDEYSKTGDLSLVGRETLEPLLAELTSEIPADKLQALGGVAGHFSMDQLHQMTDPHAIIGYSMATLNQIMPELTNYEPGFINVGPLYQPGLDISDVEFALESMEIEDPGFDPIDISGNEFTPEGEDPGFDPSDIFGNESILEGENPGIEEPGLIEPIIGPGFGPHFTGPGITEPGFGPNIDFPGFEPEDPTSIAESQLESLEIIDPSEITEFDIEGFEDPEGNGVEYDLESVEMLPVDIDNIPDFIPGGPADIYFMPQGDDMIQFMSQAPWGIDDPDGVGIFNPETEVFELNPFAQVYYSKLLADYEANGVLSPEQGESVMVLLNEMESEIPADIRHNTDGLVRTYDPDNILAMKDPKIASGYAMNVLGDFMSNCTNYEPGSLVIGETYMDKFADFTSMLEMEREDDYDLGDICVEHEAADIEIAGPVHQDENGDLYKLDPEAEQSEIEDEETVIACTEELIMGPDV